jgi:RNA polymerase sigma-70 factor (ECF subfamily)
MGYNQTHFLVKKDLKEEKVASSAREYLLPLAYKIKGKVMKTNKVVVEEALVSKLKMGDYSAFNFIFSAFYKDMVLFALRFTYSRDNAEEIVQDTFVKLWEEREGITITVSLKAYLIKLIQNRCIDLYRHRKVVIAHNDYVHDYTQCYEYNTENYLLYSELKNHIEKALGLLPDEVSETFKMNRYEGLKYKEIAEIKGVSIRTVEVRIGKALHLLRNYLSEYFVSFAALLIFFVGLR